MDKVILSSNKSQYECVFKDMSATVNVWFQKAGNLLVPLNTRSSRELFLYFCLRSVLVNTRHAGVCSERFLNARLELYPL